MCSWTCFSALVHLPIAWDLCLPHIPQTDVAYQVQCLPNLFDKPAIGEFFFDDEAVGEFSEWYLIQVTSSRIHCGHPPLALVLAALRDIVICLRSKWIAAALYTAGQNISIFVSTIHQKLIKFGRLVSMLWGMLCMAWHLIEISWRKTLITELEQLD